MKVTYNWLKDFVEIKVPAQALADKLTMAGLEVTSLQEADGDFVFEVEVTANRPDWLSVMGIAREVAAITNSKLRAYSLKKKNLSAKRYPCLAGRQALNAGTFKIDIENKKDCPLYNAKIIEEIKVGPSPDWLKKRLELVGCRSVNNIVDITNYILFTWGEPLHAFDLDKLSQGFISVRRAKNNEKITTIDGETRALDIDILVIADKERPVAIAGVMGGKDTEVTESTKKILLEAAIFNPVTIRRVRQKLGLLSNSSYRFERGINLESVEPASRQAIDLIQELAGARCVLAKSSGPAKTKKKKINLALSAVNKILGANIAPGQIKKILNNLGFKTKTKAENNLLVEPPAYRADVNLEIDLIEEVARIFGYDNIPQSLPAVKPDVTCGQTRDLVAFIKNILIGLGLNEAITYSLMDRNLLNSFDTGQGIQAIDILNPLSSEQGILRPTLLPGLAACVAYNLNQKQGYINIFEIAHTFRGDTIKPKEELSLGVVLCGIKSLFSEQGLVQEGAGFLQLKGILEALFARLGINNYDLNTRDDPSCITIYIEQEKIGRMLRLQKSALDELSIKNKDVFCLELSLDGVLSYVRLQKRFAPLPKYPAITRDISFIIKEDIAVKDILEAIQNKGRPLLSGVKIADYYKGKQIPPGYRGLTVSCIYRSDARTLTEAEVNPLHTLVSNILADTFGAKIR